MSRNADQQALAIAQVIADNYKVTDARIISLIQLGALEGLKTDLIKCTCLSELEDDAYSPGGPMSGHRRPPPCRMHSNKSS